MTNNKLIARLHELKGTLSQAEFASLINISQPSVSCMLKNGSLSIPTLITLSQKFNVSTDWILGLSDEKNSSIPFVAKDMNYADILMLFDYLVETGNIAACMPYDNYTNGETRDPKYWEIKDKILNFLLSGREQLTNKNKDIKEIWLDSVRQKFSNLNILNWKSEYDLFFENDISNEPSNDEVINWAQEVISGRRVMTQSDIYISNQNLPFN